MINETYCYHCTDACVIGHIDTIWILRMGKALWISIVEVEKETKSIMVAFAKRLFLTTMLGTSWNIAVQSFTKPWPNQGYFIDTVAIVLWKVVDLTNNSQ